MPLFLDELIADAEINDSDFLAETRETCGDDSLCLFDSLAMKDQSVGAATKAKGEENVQNANLLGTCVKSRPLKFCD